MQIIQHHLDKGRPDKLMSRKKARRSGLGSLPLVRMNSWDSERPLISRMSALSSKNASLSGSSKFKGNPVCRMEA